MILPIEFELSRVENVTAYTVKLQTVGHLRRVYNSVKISGGEVNPVGNIC